MHFSFSLWGLAPLCENMPSGKANKPGDVVRAKNGKTIQVGMWNLDFEYSQGIALISQVIWPQSEYVSEKTFTKIGNVNVLVLKNFKKHVVN